MQSLHANTAKYFRLTRKARLDKAINSAIGIIEGLALDREINARELNFLTEWLAEYEDVQAQHPFNEFVIVLQQALADGVLTLEERDDLVWLGDRLRSTEYYDQTTADLQRLQAVLSGIASDGVITERELRGLSDWLDEHEHLKSCWPYDEVGSLVTQVMADQKIDDHEQQMLQDFFGEFTQGFGITSTGLSLSAKEVTLPGLCAVCPEIRFDGTRFCFTGNSKRYTRAQFTDSVQRVGGLVMASVVKDLDYLVVGADGNPCWAYACYGRKIEKAIEMRKQGARLLIVHEHDLSDSLLDVQS